MAEAGFGDYDDENSERCSLEDEWSYGNGRPAAGKENSTKSRDDQDQLSTSGGFTDPFVPYLPSFYVGGVQRLPAGNKRSRAARLDEDYDYQSDESELSESETEPEDLSDKNYVPPKNIKIAEGMSSEDEEEKTATGRIKRRGRPPGSRNKKATEAILGRLKAKLKSPRARALQANKTASEKESELLYYCPFCSCPPASLQELKSHICRSEDDKHMLFVHHGSPTGSLCYLCPNDGCTKILPDGRSYLAHVLPCQGHVLDVQESAVQQLSQGALDKVQRVAGFLNCPVSNCYFVSTCQNQMSVHMNSHLQQVQASQMLLFRSVCSVMAKMYAGVSGFDRFLCYRCGAILTTRNLAVEHMSAAHGGRVRGVLHTVQKVDHRSRGIMVAVQCLQCSHRVPSLDQWYAHQCEPEDSHSLGNDHLQSEADRDKSVVYVPKMVAPSFEEWMWRKQSLSIKVLNSHLEKKTDDQGESGDYDKATGQLPLIRSILLAEPPTTDARYRNKTETAAPKKVGEKGTDQDDVTTMVQCDDCQEFLPENEWKSHKCFVDTVRVSESLRPLKSTTAESLPAAVRRSGSPTRTITSQSHEQATHSKLLSALASLHQTEVSFSVSRASETGAASSPTLTPAPSRVHRQQQPVSSYSRVPVLTPAPALGQSSSSSFHTHPSLLNLLTRGPGSSGSPQLCHGDPVAAPTAQRESGSVRRDSGMIRSLLMGSAAAVKAKLTPTENQGNTASARGAERVMDSEPASEDQVRQMTDAATNISERQLVARHQAGQSRSESGQKHPSASSSSQDFSDGASARKKTRTESPAEVGGGSGSAPAPLVRFLRQQGDQVMQVLGNIWDAQDDVHPHP